MKLYLENISLHYGNTSFLYNLNISSSITGIFGLSGSGKTTLMNIIGGMVTPESGKLVFNSQLFFDEKSSYHVPAHKRNIGVVFQENNLFPHLSIEKNLDFSLPYLKNRSKNIVKEDVIHLLDIEHLLKKKPYQLSGGERQRVAIGRTLLSQPELLLLDEPFSNLDKNRRKQISSYLLKINSRYDIPLLIISHDIEDILKLTKDLLIVEKGKVVASGNYLEIVEKGLAAHLITPKRYLNVFELYQKNYYEEEGLLGFTLERNGKKELLKTWSPMFREFEMAYTRVRFSIVPEDIAISKHELEETSIQNQLKGRVIGINVRENTAFVTVKCGIELVVAITIYSMQKMQLQIGSTVFCLIKSKAVEVIHIYDEGDYY